MPETINAHLAVMRSAFSTATAAGKVPDGKAASSIGTREAACNVVQAAAGVEQLIFVLQPNLAAGLCLYQRTGGATPTTTLIGLPVAFDANNAVINTQDSINLRPDRFRMVSAALRLSCINAAQFNNGWFEAVRVPSDYQTLAEGLAASDFVVEANGVPRPLTTWENGVIGSNRWPNHPSYVTGKLADLYKHQFYLQPLGDREFQRTCNNSAPNLAQYDTNFDSVVIRVHTSAAGGVLNAIHWHVVEHFELIYDPTSDRCRYHSQCLQAANLVAKVDGSIKKDPKASSIRSPNSYGVNPY